jgi:hypothetical protein
MNSLSFVYLGIFLPQHSLASLIQDSKLMCVCVCFFFFFFFLAIWICHSTYFWPALLLLRSQLIFLMWDALFFYWCFQNVPLIFDFKHFCYDLWVWISLLFSYLEVNFFVIWANFLIIKFRKFSAISLSNFSISLFSL